MAVELKRLRPNHELRKQVLLIEDEPYSEMVVSRILNKLEIPLDITWVKSAEEADATLLRHHFDLIIADILLDGDATGMDFWRQCRIRFPEIPFVVVTGLPLEKYLSAIGKDEQPPPPFLAKPLDLAESAKLFEDMLAESAVGPIQAV